MTNTEPLFIAATPQEVRTVSEAGVECELYDEYGILGIVQRCRDERRPIVGMCNAYANEDLHEMCKAGGVAFFVGNLQDGKYGILETRDRVVREAESARAGVARESLKKLGVYDTAHVVLALEHGAVVRDPVRTGLSSLDTALGGGIPTGGLTILGAVMSTGKTTLALQIADYIAGAGGRNVLFVTVEQGRAELVAKSVSRIVGSARRKGVEGVSISSAAMVSPGRRGRWSDDERRAFSRACLTYREKIGPRMWMMECDEQPTTAQILEAAEKVKAETGEAPALFVDYLQLLAPASERMTEKQAVDHNVMDLRHLARDMRVPVFVISSLNRASYAGGVTIDSFKESGAVEYGADVLLGLQPLGMEDDLASVAESRQKREANKLMETHKTAPVREVEIKVLKNRHGALPASPVPLVFDAACSLFMESGRTQPARPAVVI